MKQQRHELLRVIVGSTAHGLRTDTSDIDLRSVYAINTQTILSLGHKYKGTHWIEGDQDNTMWEIGHFLSLATQCNPTILSVFLAPTCMVTPVGVELRRLFPYVWQPKRAFDAFIGYGLNQRKKFLDKKDARPHKYAAAYIRVIWNLIELLEKGTYNIRIADVPFIGNTVKRFKNGDFTYGEVIQVAEDLIAQAKKILDKGVENTQDLEKVNDFLLQVRKQYWVDRCV